MSAQRKSFRLPWHPGSPPLIMGILNVTPDSFSDGGRFFNQAAAIRQGQMFVEAGADLLDIGGESTRPGARPVSLSEELKRTIPVISGLARSVRVPLSIDTTKAEVARQALQAGASLVNDVSALSADREMARVAAKAKCGVILMHMQGSPRTMQKRPRYRDVGREVLRFLEQAARKAQLAGIARKRIMIDPGFGFGKTLDHNVTLMRSLRTFVRTQYPVVIGPSRKSFIGKLTGAQVEDRLPGTLACVARAWLDGVAIVRVHDVAQTKQFLRLLAAIAPSGRI